MPEAPQVSGTKPISKQSPLSRKEARGVQGWVCWTGCPSKIPSNQICSITLWNWILIWASWCPDPGPVCLGHVCPKAEVWHPATYSLSTPSNIPMLIPLPGSDSAAFCCSGTAVCSKDDWNTLENQSGGRATKTIHRYIILILSLHCSMNDPTAFAIPLAASMQECNMETLPFPPVSKFSYCKYLGGM